MEQPIYFGEKYFEQKLKDNNQQKFRYLGKISPAM